MSRKRAKRKSAQKGDAGETPPSEPAVPPAEPNPHPGVASLSSRHKKTLRAIFERPTRSDIRWGDIVALIIALGGRVDEGKGSRRRFFLVRPAVFHEPHPESETSKGGVEDIRGFLRDAGVEPS
jgi:hypothetical protein